MTIRRNTKGVMTEGGTVENNENDENQKTLTKMNPLD